MKKTSIALYVFALTLYHYSVFASDEVEKKILEIRSVYQEVKDITPTLGSYSVELFGYSTEGTEVKVYHEKSKIIRLILVTYYGEMGRRDEEYYFDKNEELRFIYQVNSSYNHHIMESLKPNNALKVASKDEYRFYFYNNALIRWLGPKKQIARYSSSELRKKFEKDTFEFIKAVKNEKNTN